MGIIKEAASKPFDWSHIYAIVLGYGWEEMQDLAEYEMANDELAVIPRYVAQSNVMPECIHENAAISEVDTGGKFFHVFYFHVWECSECGGIGEVGKEN